MPHEKEARQTWKAGRATVQEHDRSISQAEFERGCRTLPLAFAIMVALYALWEVFA